MTRATWGGQGLFSFYAIITKGSQYKNKHGRNLERETDVDTMEGAVNWLLLMASLTAFL